MMETATLLGENGSQEGNRPRPFLLAGSAVCAAFSATVVAAGLGYAAGVAFIDPLGAHNKSHWIKSHNWKNGYEKNNTGWRRENVRFTGGMMNLDLTRRPDKKRFDRSVAPVAHPSG